MKCRYGLFIIAGAVSTASMGLSTNSFAQSCGCETASTCTSSQCKTSACRSCCNNNHVVLHIQREPLAKRRSLSIVPESASASVATAPIVQSVAMVSPMMFQVQPMAIAASMVPMQAYQPVAFNAIAQSNMSAQTQTVNAQAPASSISEELKNLTREVKQISEDLDKMILIVQRHDKVIETLVQERAR